MDLKSTVQKANHVYKEYGIGPLARGALYNSRFIDEWSMNVDDYIHNHHSEKQLTIENKAKATNKKVSPSSPVVCKDRQVINNLEPNDFELVLSRKDVDDFGLCHFIADPFLYQSDDGTWHLFFEVYNDRREPDSAIGHAVSTNGINWNYDQIVLETSNHLSFPYIFDWDKDIYMMPEEGGANGRSIPIYKSNNFPYGWEKQNTLVNVNHRVSDSILFRWTDYWWILVGDSENSALHIYYSNELFSRKWNSHPENPVVKGRVHGERPAGRPIITESGPIVLLQDCKRQYGDKVRAFKITDLSPSIYIDQEISTSPILYQTGKTGWQSGRMHHIDIQPTESGWLAVADGNTGLGSQIFRSNWSIGIAHIDKRK